MVARWSTAGLTGDVAYMDHISRPRWDEFFYVGEVYVEEGTTWWRLSRWKVRAKRR